MNTQQWLDFLTRTDLDGRGGGPTLVWSVLSGIAALVFAALFFWLLRGLGMGRSPRAVTEVHHHHGDPDQQEQVDAITHDVGEVALSLARIEGLLADQQRGEPDYVGTDAGGAVLHKGWSDPAAKAQRAADRQAIADATTDEEAERLARQYDHRWSPRTTNDHSTQEEHA